MSIHQTADRIRKLHEKAARLLAEADDLRKYLRAHLGLGRHGGVTVYKVRQTRIRAHTRRGYTATRCR